MALELPVLAPPKLFADSFDASRSCQHSPDDEDTKRLLALLSAHPHVVEKWVSEHADVSDVVRVQTTARARLRADDEGKDDLGAIEAPRSRRQSGAPAAGDGSTAEQSHQQTAALLRPAAPPSRYDIYRSSFRGRNSLTSNLFRNFVSSSSQAKGCNEHHGKLRERLESMNEDEVFMELLKDIANELDMDVLCHKIMVNVSFLTNADRGSLFLAKGPLEHRYLVTKLFDVTVDSDLEDVLWPTQGKGSRVIPFGVGIAGHVAQTKESLNLRNAYQDSRFDQSIDQVTGYRTESLLCMPMCNYEGHVTGVAQIINKRNGETEFTARDEMLFRKYLTFCGIGIQNAQLFEMSVREFKRNQFLLNLAQQIFEEQNNLERLITKILREAGEMTSAKQCCLYLLEGCMTVGPDDLLEDRNRASIEGEHPVFSKQEEVRFETIYSLRTEWIAADEMEQVTGDDSNASAGVGIGSSASGLKMLDPCSDRRDTRLCQLAMTAIISGEVSSEVLPVPSTAEPGSQVIASRKCRDETTSSSIRIVIESGESEYSYPLQVLSVPVREGVQRRVVGVVQLIQKENVDDSPFSDSDAALVEAVAIFCGLGVRNTKMYEGAMKLMAKQKVSLECLSYHAAAAPEDTHKLIEASSAMLLSGDQVPETTLYRFDFNDFDLTDIETCLSVVKMFHTLKLNAKFMIPHEVMCQWIMSVKKNYRPIKYHNWRHAINVAQTMFAVLTTGKLGQFMSDEEIFALLVACLSHDLDHRGTNNAFQAKSASPLAVLYTTSPMEHHHFDQCIMILSNAGSNILQAVSPDTYRKIIKHIESAILATDLATYYRKRTLFLDMVDRGEWDWQEDDKKDLLCGMLMTASDVAAISKPWEIQQRTARLVADEFFEQGDIERLQLNQEPIAMMDREKKDELPKMQVNFIDNICLPLYKALSDSFPWLKPLYDGCYENRSIWQKMAEQVEMGLTWINSTSLHDAMTNVGGKIEMEKVYLVPRHSIRSTRSSQVSLTAISVDLERRRSSGMSSDRGSSRSRKSSDQDLQHMPPAPASTPTASLTAAGCKPMQCPTLTVEHVDPDTQHQGSKPKAGSCVPRLEVNLTKKPQSSHQDRARNPINADGGDDDTLKASSTSTACNLQPKQQSATNGKNKTPSGSKSKGKKSKDKICCVS